MQNSYSKKTKYSLFCRITSAMLSFVMVISALVFTPVQAEAAEGYNVKIKIKVIDDADGWNSANMKLYAENYGNGISSSQEMLKQWDIISSVDDEEENEWTYNCGKYFPTKVVIYTDFGGGVTFRYWQAEVKIYVNGTQIKAEHINSNSGVFVTSDDTNTLTIDKNVYPYPTSFTATSDNEVPQDMTFYQEEYHTDKCWGVINTKVYDQYGVAWELPGEITNDTDFWSSKYPSGDGYKSNVYSTNGLDHTSTYTYTFETANSIYSTKSFSVDTEFVYRHSVKVLVNDEVVYTARNFSGSFVDIEAQPPTGYTISDYYLSGYGTLVQSDIDGSYQYTFGAGDGEITAELTPIKYKIAFNGNGSTSGKITTKTATYDKALQLPSNSFSRTDGYHFVGWNTEPDGSGTGFSNKEFVQNLSSVSGETITLYAQWEQNVYDVTLVYPAELNLEDGSVSVVHGGNAYAPTVIPAASTSGEEDEESQTSVVLEYTDAGHYQLTTSSEEFENITSDGTINLSYELVQHSYGPATVLRAPTCTVDGVSEEVCSDCGYVKSTSIPHSHQAITTEDAVPATCTKAGRTERIYCAACGETITPSTSTAATGHDYYDPEWSFNDDYTEATATFTCKKCEDQQTVTTSSRYDISHKDEGKDRVYSTVISFNGVEYTGSVTRENLYAEIPYVNENGQESTIIASKLIEGDEPEGSALFIEGEINLSDTLQLKENTKLILCDGAKLNIDMGDKSGKAIYCWYPNGSSNTDEYNRSLNVYGQRNQSGELNVSLHYYDSSNDAYGIYCSEYKQYGAKVNINISESKNSSTAAGLYTTGSGNVEIHSGDISVYSKRSNGILSNGGNVFIKGGKVTALTENTASCSGIWSRKGAEFSLKTNDDYITLNGRYHFNNSISVAEDNKLIDENDNIYTGTLTNAQLTDLENGKTLKLYDSLDNGYNLTLDDNISVNFFIDTPFYEAQGGHIECSYIATSNEKSAERVSFIIEDKDLAFQDNGTRKITLNAAPAQIAEPYIITVYDENGNEKETISVSIQDYCNAILSSEANAEYHAVAQSLLDYGALADEYFGYSEAHKAVTGEDYEISHSENYKADVDVFEFRSKAHASITQGSVLITDVTYVALLDPEFRFYLSSITEAQASKINVSIDLEGLQAKMVKTSNGICVKVTGLTASDFSKVFTLTIGDTVITYNGYAYLYTVLREESTADAKLKNLAKGIYRYAAACEEKFSLFDSI